MRIRETATIDRPAADTFRFVAVDHFTNHPRWDPSIESIEPLTPGPIALGSRAKVRRRRGSPDEVLEVTEFVPPGRFATRDNIGPFLLTVTCDVASLTPDRSSITLTADTDVRGPMRFVAPLLRPVFRRQMRRSLRRIREMVEAESPPPSRRGDSPS